MDLQSDFRLAQEKPQRSGVLLEVKGQQQTAFVPRSELQADRHTLSAGDPRQTQKTSGVSKGDGHVDGFRARKGDVTLQQIIYTASVHNAEVYNPNIFVRVN